MQQLHKSIESWSGSKPKHGKKFKFARNTQKTNVMENDDIPIPRKKKGTKVAIKRRKIKSMKLVASEKGCTYCIDNLNLSDTVHAENDSV